MQELNSEQTRAQVEDALEQLRPFLKADGGDMELVEITEEGTVRVELLGACSNCSMSMMTLKAGLEEALIKAVPAIKKVEAVNVPDPSVATPFGQ